MAKHTFTFRGFAVDESANWNPPEALEGVPVFGLYFICEGERTYCCSLTPSTWAEFLSNEFLTNRAPDPDAAQDELDRDGDLLHDDGGQRGTYFGYVDCDAAARAPYISPRYTFTLDSRDYDLDAGEYRDAFESARKAGDSSQGAAAFARRRCLNEFAWEAAREYFAGNPPFDIPVLCEDSAYESHRRRQLMREAESFERAYGPPPLFRAAGISAPLALAPGAAQ